MVRPPDVRAIYISASGYTEGAIQIAREFLSHRLCVLVELEELYACLNIGGELVELLRQHNPENIESYTKMALDYFGPQMAIGVEIPQPQSDLVMDVGKMQRELADFVKVPCLSGPTFHFVDPADESAFEYLQQPDGPGERGWKASDNKKHLSCLHSETDITERYVDDDESPHEAGELARRLSWRPSLNRRIIPVQDFERGFDPNSYLFDQVIRGATERYGEISEAVKQQINKEFEDIKKKNLSVYLLLYKQVIDFLDDQGISRGVGRGPSVASIIAYCIGITKLDPMHYRLAYRSLTSESEVFPPIRIEVPSGSVPRVIQWLKTAFGEGHVVQIGRRQDKKHDAIVEEIANWAGLSDEEKALALGERGKRRGAGAAQRLKDESEAKQWKRWRNPTFVNELASRLTSRPKSLAPSPGKWTISAEPLEYMIPTIRLPQLGKVTDISESAIDRMGGPRIEFVSHHLLNLLDRAKTGVLDSGISIDFKQMPIDDRGAFDLISRGDTTGIPPLEAITVKSMLRKGHPTNLLQLLKIKTDSQEGRSADNKKDLTEEVPDMLLSVQLAFMKAHHPVAFYAAALSCAAELGLDLTVLVRAIHRAGIEILPPDINLSGPLCTVFGGKIRLGLLMVRQLGEKALEEILSVRLGGRFNNLTEFCAGISPRAVNLRVLQNLIGAGAFDSLGQSRGKFSNQASILYKRHRTHSSGSGKDGGKDQVTLFDLGTLGSLFEDSEAEAEGAPAWDYEVRVAREREALGFNLALDPMVKYPKTLEALQPLAPHQIQAKMSGRDIKVAGMVDHFDSDGPIAGGNGGLLVDMEGVAILLSPALAKVSRHSLTRGNPVMVYGRFLMREGYPVIEAYGLWSMEDLETQSAAVARIRLNLRGENRTTLKHLLELAKTYPGESGMDLEDYDHIKGFTYRGLARRKVHFCSPLYQGLCKILPPERIELFGKDGCLLAIATARSGE